MLYGKELLKTNKTEFRIEKAIKKNCIIILKKKVINYIWSKKVMIIRLRTGKVKISVYNTTYYAEPYNYGRNKIKVELDLSNNAGQSCIKIVADVDT